jgi:predicted dehydrogenase
MKKKGDELTAALVGCGRIGAHTAPHLRETLPSVWFPYSHMEAIQTVPGVRVTAVCDQAVGVAKLTAEKYLVSRWFDDYEAMIAQMRPDLLLVATRMSGRSDIIEFAANSGVGGVHFEKPLAGSLRECRRAMAAADQVGMKVGYGAVRRCMDVPRRAKLLLESGELGGVLGLTIESKGVDLLWAHPHNFDLISYFLGCLEVSSVQAALEFDPAVFHEQTLDADPLVRGAMIRFETGVMASIIPSGLGAVRIACEKGELVIGGNASWLTMRVKSEQPSAPFMPPTLIEVPFTASGRQRALTELADAVRGCGEAPHTPQEILRSNQLGLACAWSAVNSGRAVRLEEVPEDFCVTGRNGDLFA